jgi:hypothetical protein
MIQLDIRSCTQPEPGSSAEKEAARLDAQDLRYQASVAPGLDQAGDDGGKAAGSAKTRHTSACPDAHRNVSSSSPRASAITVDVIVAASCQCRLVITKFFRMIIMRPKLAAIRVAIISRLPRRPAARPAVQP